MKLKTGRFIFLFLILVFIAFIHIPTTQAKGVNAPLLMDIGGGFEGDLWAWNEQSQSLKQLTAWGYNYDPVLSPDGKWVAYNSSPKFVIDDPRSGIPPSNLWVLNVATNQGIRIAGQPAGATQDTGYHRPRAAWSPDSKALAWGEIVGNKTRDDGSYGGYLYHLVIYDLNQQSQKVILNDMPGYQIGMSGGQDVRWGKAGIAYIVSSDDQVSDPNQVPVDTVYIYSTDGVLRYKVPDVINDASCGLGADNSWWVKENNSEYVYVTGCPDRPEFLIDPATGKKLQASGKPELYSTKAPDGLSLYLVYDFGSPVWHLAIPGKPSVELPAEIGFNQVAISPDGQEMAYTDGKTLSIYNRTDDTTTTIPVDLNDREITWLGWGPTDWRIRRELD